MKIAILGNYATQFLEKPLKKILNNSFSNLDVYSAEYNSIDFELLDTNSQLFLFEPDFVIWHESTLQIRDIFYQTPLSNRQKFADDYKNRLSRYLSIIVEILPRTKIIFPDHNLLFNDNIYGNYSPKVKSSWDFQIQKVNYLLNELALDFPTFYPTKSRPPEWSDIITDYSLVVNAELHFTPNYLQWLSNSISNTIFTFTGKFKKCVILDLDNTLWGGIIGDDGLENINIGTLGIGKAFTRLQKWLKELKNRGVILAVCSKNEDSIAKTPFLQHPEMVLKLDDIAVFKANWNSKADNINQIQKILNIGFDSIVFLDDNPAEREIVRNFLPEVCVPELPLDPAYYLPFLISQNLFETTSYTENDTNRTKQYQEEAKRVELSQSITNMDDYLKSLNMKVKIQPFQDIDIERIAQLTQRSNQFNLRTIRYTTNEIIEIQKNASYLTASVEMEDKFGTYGLISAVIIKLEGKKAYIDTWIMSCRVLKRGVEATLMNYIVAQLINLKVTHLHGEYILTAKNKLVRNLLADLGMSIESPNKYQLSLKEYTPLISYIQIEKP
jgi:FkbH-like protein